MKSTWKVLIGIFISLLLAFGVASAVTAGTHAGAVRQPYPTAVE